MGRRKKPPAAKNPAAWALAQLRWARATDEEKKAVGRELTASRARKKKGRKKPAK